MSRAGAAGCGRPLRSVPLGALLLPRHPSTCACLLLSHTHLLSPGAALPPCVGWAIQRIRQFYMRKVKFTQQNWHEKLSRIIDDFPKVDDIHPFYADLLNVLYDKVGAGCWVGGGWVGRDVQAEAYLAGGVLLARRVLLSVLSVVAALGKHPSPEGPPTPQPPTPPAPHPLAPSPARPPRRTTTSWRWAS